MASTGNNASTNKNTETGIAGSRTFWLAVGILLAFFGFYGYALVTGIKPSPPHDFTGIEKIASTLGPIAAVVIGYYFGQRPVQALTEQVQDVVAKKEKARETLEETSDKTSEQRNRFTEQAQDLEAQLKTKDDIIRHLSKELAQQRQP